MADWKSLQIEVPGKDLLEPTRAALEGLLILLDTLKAILDTIKTFLIDFGNPIRALVEALIGLIEETLLSLKATGAFALFHVPNPIEDPNFDNHRGFDAFTEVFRQSLYDSKDFNRPQPRTGSTTGGFVLMLVTADAPFALVGKIKQLMRFFNREFSSPRYESPQNLKAAPLGPGGDPILSVLDVFAKSSTSIGLTWDLPTSSETPDLGFQDVLSRVANEFVPPNFLIEKSTDINPPSELINIADRLDPASAGKVEQVIDKLVAGTTSTVAQRSLVRDIYDDLYIKFNEYIVVDTGVTGIVGQLGRIRYVDSDVEPGTTYYYRVRAFSGSLDVTSDKQINFAAPKAEQGKDEPKVTWPSSDSEPEASCVVGRASSIVSVKMPPVLTGAAATFDVIGNLRRVFQAAYTCDFHRNIRGAEVVIGEESLTKLAGPIAGFSSEQLLGQILRAPGNTIAAQMASLTAAASFEFPWENRGIRRQAARVADGVGSAFLEAGGTALETFRDLLQAPNPVLSSPTLEAALTELTSTTATDLQQGESFVAAYDDNDFREALLGVVTHIKSFTGGGLPPDWVSFSPLRDIVPWSGEIIYSLLDKIQSLVDAFNGVMGELNDFISLLSRKIDTLERLLEQLIQVLDFVESLQIGAFVLVVPEVQGSVDNWVAEVEQAGGTVPPSGPGGYSAGVALAYVGPNITAIKSAFSLIFGV
jgi:hypothetical protein